MSYTIEEVLKKRLDFQATALWLDGYSYQDIADLLGFKSKAYMGRVIRKFCIKWRVKRVQKPRLEVRSRRLWCISYLPEDMQCDIFREKMQ
jgi:hypothetical protein